MTTTNLQVIYKNMPAGSLQDSDDTFELKKSEINLDTVEIPDNHVLLENLWLAVGPYMRGRMIPPEIESYIEPFQVDSIPDAQTVSKVLRSNDPNFKPGDIVLGQSRWENYSVIGTEVLFPLALDPRVPPTYYLSTLGFNGLTAWAGLKNIGQPKEGETILISGAYGAVGLAVGQLCKLKGLRVVGIAGSDEKINSLVKDFNFDSAINYKTCANFEDAIKEHCPNGVDIYWDNVGGQILEDTILCCNNFARVIMCGMISQYNFTDPHPISTLLMAIPKRLRLEAFIVTDHFHQLQGMVDEFLPLVLSGKLKVVETVVEGVHSIPKALVDVFNGKNRGQQLVKLSSKL